MMRRRRPIMRGAMVGGAGYVAGKAGARRAAQQSAPQQQPPAGAQAAAAGGSSASSGSSGMLEQLKQLGELRDSGVLTPEEFEREKQKLLGGDAQ
jgi:hypothetical protein